MQKSSRYIFFLVLFTFSIGVKAQSNTIKHNKIGCSEKWWALTHLFKLKRAIIISKEVLLEAENQKQNPRLDGDGNGGQLDAFRHAYWMAKLTKSIGAKAALKLGKAHERTNYRTFKKGKVEDGSLPDNKMSEMDLWNNRMGADIMKKFHPQSDDSIKILIIEAIERGELRIIKKNSKGDFLDCDNRTIQSVASPKSWYSEKCLMPSNNKPLR